MSKSMEADYKTIQCQGAVFDLDGVLTQTAKVHFKAWKKTFDDFLSDCYGKDSFDPFSYEDDYLPYVDGKPRYQGVKSFLESRDVHLPFGDPSDEAGFDTICAVGNSKNEMFRSIVAEEGVEIYDSAIGFVKDLKEQNVLLAVASSSKNCRYILEKTELIDYFETVVDGNVSKELGLSGKPAPDIFVVAAENMGLKPNQCMMAEDAFAGVEAGKNGNFGLVLGISRNGEEEKLKAYGADLVIEDFTEIDVDDVNLWFSSNMEDDSWFLNYYGYEPSEERLRETLTTVGNGYFGTRGCFVSEEIEDDVHYPGTYIAGLYNKLPTEIHGKNIYNNDFVNCPNWLLVECSIDDEDYFSPLNCEILEYSESLDIKKGLLHHKLRFKDDEGRITQLSTERLASMDQPHIAALRYSIRAENYSGTMRVRSSLDGRVYNYGVNRYRDLSSHHLKAVSEGEGRDHIYLCSQTKSSKVNIIMFAKHHLHNENRELEVERKVTTSSGIVSEEFTFEAKKQEDFILDKEVAIYSSQDIGIKDPDESARQDLEKTGGYDSLKEKHTAAWAELWERAEIHIEGDRFANKIIHLHCYHLLVTASPHNTNIDTGLPARGLHGESYRGHIFWDELFIAPFYNLRFPEITRSHLMYRYRRLDAARENARAHGFEGALYPWQSADSGEEESQEIHYNPQSGEWDPDLSRNQRHISISIAYNIWNYFYTSGDDVFINTCGMEMLLEIARFWASIAQYDSADGRYHISGVMGPDEFHEKYPDAEEGGFIDNSYTNLAAAWLLHKTVETYDYRPEEVKKELKKKIGLVDDELGKWNKISQKLNIEFCDEKILCQFKGWNELEEIDWDRYKEKYENIHRMDRILKAEGDSPNKYKVIKQADVLMIFYILAPEQVCAMLERMDYGIGDPTEFMRKNYEYYIQYTSHGSTLSYIVHCAILKYLESHRNDQWRWFMEALKSDVLDTQGGTTPEGIHSGVMAGSIDIVMKSFAGLNLFRDKIYVNPDLPNEWEEIRFVIQHQGELYRFKIDLETVQIERISGGTEPLLVVIGEEEYSITNEQAVEAEYR